jgi:hypothetical protein
MNAPQQTKTRKEKRKKKERKSVLLLDGWLCLEKGSPGPTDWRGRKKIKPIFLSGRTICKSVREVGDTAR